MRYIVVIFCLHEVTQEDDNRFGLKVFWSKLTEYYAITQSARPVLMRLGFQRSICEMNIWILRQF
ncbi:hypothetical protein PHOSAC3_150167 [Mesotoga infera]|nr:hypothetical protein PHOSAC3_150167 [Mesotoga infera]